MSFHDTELLATAHIADLRRQARASRLAALARVSNPSPLARFAERVSTASAGSAAAVLGRFDSTVRSPLDEPAGCCAAAA